MKRCLKTLGVTFIFLVITSVVGYAASFIPLGFWEIFGIASGILIASVLLSVLLRKSAGIKIAAMLLNAISMGFYLRSWYINRGFDNPLWLMLCVALLASVYLLIFILPLYVDVQSFCMADIPVGKTQPRVRSRCRRRQNRHRHLLLSASAYYKSPGFQNYPRHQQLCGRPA